jgi:hypothetical protein
MERPPLDRTKSISETFRKETKYSGEISLFFHWIMRSVPPAMTRALSPISLRRLSVSAIVVGLKYSKVLTKASCYWDCDAAFRVEGLGFQHSIIGCFFKKLSRWDPGDIGFRVE